MRVLSLVLAMLLGWTAPPANAELLGKEWISEAEMKQQSNFARQHSLALMELRCKFREGVENPGRQHVLFRADFSQVQPAIAWGWTFDANAPQNGPEQQAKDAGFELASEDYFEISGVTWVRCKVWHRP